MAKFTKALRQKIVREFCERHDGHFDPHAFVQEVRATGPDHPAYEWFDFDVESAAEKWWLVQARDFVRDLRVNFTVTHHTPSQQRVTVEYGPAYVSPLATRSSGGGYIEADPANDAYRNECCQQAAKALAAWLNRNRAALAWAEINPNEIESLIYRLEHWKLEDVAAE